MIIRIAATVSALSISLAAPLVALAQDQTAGAEWNSLFAARVSDDDKLAARCRASPA